MCLERKERDERLRAAPLNIDEVGWRTARERSAVELESASASSSVANYPWNYNHISATEARNKAHADTHYQGIPAATSSEPARFNTNNISVPLESGCSCLYYT